MISDETYEKIKSNILQKLSAGLSKDLPYHGVHHTLDVLKGAERIAEEEKISDHEDMFLLKIACLYHDSGFLFIYKGHEEVSCKIAREELSPLSFNNNQLDLISGMIMATKIPQTPHNKLEEIICDADLDYLGRPDFFQISDTLYQEMKIREWVSDKKDWNIRQVSFFKSHHYFTTTSKKQREPQKQKHLEMIEAMM